MGKLVCPYYIKTVKTKTLLLLSSKAKQKITSFNQGERPNKRDDRNDPSNDRRLL